MHFLRSLRAQLFVIFGCLLGTTLEQSITCDLFDYSNTSFTAVFNGFLTANLCILVSPFVGVGRQPTGLTVIMSNYTLGNNVMTMYNSLGPDSNKEVKEISQTGNGFTLTPSQLNSGSFFAFVAANDTSTVIFFVLSCIASSTTVAVPSLRVFVGVIVAVCGPLLVLSFIKCGEYVQRRKKTKEVGSKADIMLKRIQRRINIGEQIAMWLVSAACFLVFLLFVLDVIVF